MIHARKDYNRIQDPMGIIPEDEPVFLLRAQDIAAPEAVISWIEAHIRHGGDIDIAKLALDQVMRMKEWQEKHGWKKADIPEGSHER